MAVEEYDRWQARRELLRHTVASVAATGPRALRQHSDPRPGVNFLRYAPGSGLSMGDIAAMLDGPLAGDGRAVERFTVSVRGQHSGEQPTRLHPATVALVQAAHVPTAAIQLPRLFSPRRFRAAIVHWELPQVPVVQRLALPFVDEVWATSEFVQQAFARVTSKPVRVLPLALPPASGHPGALRERLGLREQYVFGYQCDLASSGERKNPVGVVQAYLKAFPRPQLDVRLLLKAVHAASSPHIWTQVRRLAAGRPDVLLVDEYWPGEVVEAFFLDIDCYVSLHRAEGFGITLARAMAAGRPVVATGYSGNLTFMSETTAVLVPWREVAVGQDPVYPAGGTWASPDLDAAAEALRRLAGDRNASQELGESGRRHVSERLSAARASDFLRAHLPR